MTQPAQQRYDSPDSATPAGEDTGRQRVRVLVAEDHSGMRELLRILVEPVFEVIACVDDGYALLTAAEALIPDVIVADITMPGLDGIAAAGQILRKNPDARIVFVTVHNDAALVQHIFAVGAYGYVLKLAASDDLVPAIHAALRREQFVSQLARGGAR
jgi:DNA-binding NarL/FixJ family response regulator